MTILQFNNMKEYQEWLSGASYNVQLKAQKFHELYGQNVIPVVIIIDSDTYGEGGGCHIFIHPQHITEVLQYIVFE